MKEARNDGDDNDLGEDSWEDKGKRIVSVPNASEIDVQVLDHAHYRRPVPFVQHRRRRVMFVRHALLFPASLSHLANHNQQISHTNFFFFFFRNREKWRDMRSTLR